MITVFTVILVLSTSMITSEGKTKPFYQDEKVNMKFPNQNKDSIVLSPNGSVRVSVKKRANMYSYVVIEKGKQARCYYIPSGKRITLPLMYGNGKYTITSGYAKTNKLTDFTFRVAKEKKINVKIDTKKQFLSHNFIIQGDYNIQIKKLLQTKFKGYQAWSTKTKIKKVHDYIANNYEYSDDLAEYVDSHWYTPTFSDRIKSKSMICYDASAMTASLLREMGVQTIFVGGYWKGDKKTFHAWNEVWYKGKWRVIDTTFDLRIRFGNDYMYSVDPIFKKKSSYIVKEWF